jgi:hypothetical protein
MKIKKTAPAVKPVEQQSVAELREAAARNATIIDSAKEQLDVIQTELRRRFEEEFKLALAKQEKQHGQTTFEVEGVKMTAEITARREWDSDKLKAIARTMPFDQVERTFNIKFSVPEKVYNGIRDEKLLDALIDARTVKYSETKFIFAS